MCNWRQHVRLLQVLVVGGLIGTLIGGAGIAITAPGTVAAAAPSRVPRYSITDLGTAGDGSFLSPIYSQPTGINMRGQIVGYKIGGGPCLGSGGFAWTPGIGIQLLSLRDAKAINDQGQIAGSIYAPGGSFCMSHAALLQPDGTIQDLDPTSLTGTSSNTNGINNRGQVVVLAGEHGFLWTKQQGMRDIGNFIPKAINSLGQITGFRRDPSGTFMAVLWQDGQPLRDIGTLPGSTESLAFSINDQQQIVGSSGNRAFTWDAQNGMRAIDLLPGTAANTASAINAKGQVVGSAYADSSTTTSSRAFVWQPGLAVQELPGLAGVSNATISANAINDIGQIAGAIRWQEPLVDQPLISVTRTHIVLWQIDH